MSIFIDLSLLNRLVRTTALTIALLATAVTGAVSINAATGHRALQASAAPASVAAKPHILIARTTASPSCAGSFAAGSAGVPATRFLIGSDAFYPEERPHVAVAVAAFGIDAHEVTVTSTIP